MSLSKITTARFECPIRKEISLVVDCLQVTPVEERHSSYDSRPKLSMMRTSENIIDDVPTIPQLSVPPTPAPVLHLPKASYLIPEMMSWKEISVTYDRFLFYTFSIVLALLTVIFLTILGTGGEY